MMNYKPVALFCNCGQPPDKITEVGLTPERQLVIHWWCFNCNQAVYVFKDLAECWRECPREQDLPLPEASDRGPKNWAEDSVFLHQLGITLPDGEG